MIDDKRVAQQRLHLDRRRHGAQMRDRDIDRAALELLGGVGADAAARGAGSRAAPLGQRHAARRPTSATSAYSAMPAVKMPALFAGSKPAPRLSAASICSIAAETSGAISRARAVGSIPAGVRTNRSSAKRLAQPRQRVAHRRLRQADAAGGAGHGALAHQRVEGFQQVEVDGANIH